ncbi:MAG: glycosyltransferase family 4 protein [Desulfovibrio sp.]|nr:glycosyltransferase family 4 protein [Desulfovibrio sp.]
MNDEIAKNSPGRRNTETKHDGDGRPLPAGLPHIAYILLWYPLFTQPFIFREVEILRRRLPLEVYSLYASNPRCCSKEMLAALPSTRTAGLKLLPAFLLETARCLFTKPAMFRRLFIRSLCRPWRSLESFAENLWAFLAGVYLGRQLREDGIDMIYAPWPRGTATAAWVAAEIAGIPFGTSARGDNLDPADPDLGAKFSAALFIRANNAHDMKRIENFNQGQAKGKVELIYNSLTLPLATRRQETVLSKKTARLLALGRFDVTKGFDVLLHACHLLKESGLDFHLTLAGGGGKVMGLGRMGRTLANLRKELGLKELVSMPGFVSHDSLPDILLSHDIFLAPCVVHESGRRDGIPNTIIEAMAYGLPVIGTSVNALPEVILDNTTGLLVPPGNADALADAIRRLVAHPEDARCMGQNGMALAEEMFDTDRNCRRLSDLLVRQNARWKASCAA